MLKLPYATSTPRQSSWARKQVNSLPSVQYFLTAVLSIPEKFTFIPAIFLITF